MIITCSPLGRYCTVNTVPHMPFCVSTFDSMLILCNIFVELEHFILFNKYHNLIYYRININKWFKSSSRRQSCCKYSILSLKGRISSDLTGKQPCKLMHNNNQMKLKLVWEIQFKMAVKSKEKV